MSLPIPVERSGGGAAAVSAAEASAGEASINGWAGYALGLKKAMGMAELLEKTMGLVNRPPI
jgi:hypothetical protein